MDCGAFSVKLKASNIQHDCIVCSMFSGRPFGAGEKAEYYDGTSVYSNLTTQKQVQKNHGDGVKFVTVDDFPIWAFKVPATLLDRAR